MIGVRLDKNVEGRLQRLARDTHRSMSYYVKEAIAEYLSEKEDTLLALSRLEQAKKPMTTEEMWAAVGWNGETEKKSAKRPLRPATSRGKSHS